MTYFIWTQYAQDKSNPRIFALILHRLDIACSDGREASWNMPVDPHVIQQFIGNDAAPKFYGYNCAADWLLFLHAASGIEWSSTFPTVCHDVVSRLRGFKWNNLRIDGNQAAQLRQEFFVHFGAATWAEKIKLAPPEDQRRGKELQAEISATILGYMETWEHIGDDESKRLVVSTITGMAVLLAKQTNFTEENFTSYIQQLWSVIDV